MESTKRPRTLSTFNPFSTKPHLPPHMRDSVNSTAGNTPPRPMGSWRAVGPNEAADSAASSTLAGRKLFDRNQTDKHGSGTMKPASHLPPSTPGRVFSSSTFRPDLTNGRSAKFAFSPRVPANTMRETFPTATPGRSYRNSTADLSGRAMSKASSSNLFPMRIASPPPELDGEELARQVPRDPNRIGSVYADEFLGHLVPPELDDMQRRQFFCILDLRRLKYAANEIFAKKDWRVNIMNFAKEYEKSRSLIMLRYGLYEFRTVPVSGELMKKWREENNVPEEEDDISDAPTPKPNGTKNILRSSTKRRAEDELTKDSVSTSDSSTQNKRRAIDREPLAETTAPPTNVAAPASSKKKRGAEQMDEPDENDPNKAQKPKPSATLSLFEQVANKTPVKSSAGNISGASSAKPLPNPFAPATKPSNGLSVFDSGAKVVSSGNIFGHLSSQSSAKGSGNEADEDDETDGESEAGDSEAQASHSEAPSVDASGGVGTPSISETSETFSKGPSIFDRITKGPDGQPLRASFAETESKSDQAGPGLPAFGIKRTASPVKQSQPQDKTWKPDTPIKFGTAAATQDKPLFGSTNAQTSTIFAKSTTTPSVSFGATTTPKAADAPASGVQSHDFAKSTPKPLAPSIFGQAVVPSESSSSFSGGASKAAASAGLGNGLFPPSSVSQPKKPEDQQTSSEPAPAPSTPSAFSSPSKAPASSLFGNAGKTPVTETPAKPLFSGISTPASTALLQPGSLFGGAKSATGVPAFNITNGDSKTAAPVFGSSSAPTMFGAKSTAPAAKGEEMEEPARKRKAPASDRAADVFGSKSVAASSKAYTFGGNAPPPANLAPKTVAAAKGATDAASVFGASSKEGEKKFIFGSAPTPATLQTTTATPAMAPAPSSLFGSTNAPSQSEEQKKQPSMFASSGATSGAPTTGFSFGSASQTPPSSIFAPTTSSLTKSAPAFGNGGGSATSSFTFNAGGGQASFKNPFVSGVEASATPSFNFGAASNNASQGSTAPFQFGANTATPTPSASFTFGAGSQPANSTPATPGSASFTFGAGASATNASSQPSIFGGANNDSSNMFSFQPPANAAQGIFSSHLGVAPAGSSTGTNTPFFGGASSLATTPATGTPEPEAKNDVEQKADEDGKTQEQISLTEGGPGEEDESVVHEVRAKALKFIPHKHDDDDDAKDKDKKNPWKTQGVGPFRILKHKTTGAIRMLLRAEPRGNVALNRMVLPNVHYKVENGGKYVKVMTGTDDGKGLETWMLQVKTKQAAQKLADVLETNKSANKK